MELLDKLIELAQTQGGTIAVMFIGALILLLSVPTFTKRMAEARKIEAETKKIRAQGDADTDLADTKNTAKILDIMERLTANDTEKNRMIQAEFEKRREEGELNRLTLDKVSSALTEFNTENKAWRFDLKTNAHMVDGSLLSLASKIEGMAGTLEAVQKEGSESHEWVRETIASMYEKIVIMSTQMAFIHQRVVEAAKKPDPTPPTEPASAPVHDKVTPLNADAAAAKAELKPTGTEG